jgi:hypothetical protein
MSKPYPFSNIDPDHRCIDCGQPLKRNLLAKKPDALRCYVCHRLQSNNTNINRVALKLKQRHLKAKHQC